MKKKDKLLLYAKAKILKALAHPTRLWMTEQLINGEKCVCEFTNNIDVDFSTISKHLSILKEAGIVENEKRGKKVFYHLKIPCILTFMNCIDTVVKSDIKEKTKLL